jgi:hypothetical protein
MDKQVQDHGSNSEDSRSQGYENQSDLETEECLTTLRSSFKSGAYDEDAPRALGSVEGSYKMFGSVHF